MSSFDRWGEDEDIDVSATSVGGDGWGDDDDFFGDDDGDDDGDDEKKDSAVFPSTVPAVADSKIAVKSPQSNNDQEELNLNDGWGEDNDFFDDDDDDNDDEKGEVGIGCPPAAPAIAVPNPMSIPAQSNNDNDTNKQKVDDGWGDDDDFFEDDGSDEKITDEIGFPPAASTIVPSNQMKNPLQPKNDEDQHNFDDGWGEDDDFFDDASDENGGDVHIQSGHSAQSGIGSATTRQAHNIITQQPHHMPAPYDLNLERNPMVIELSKYIQSLDRMLSSINAVLEFEYNTCQKAEELLEYYDKRPQLAEYTRTKELQRMNYEIVLPDGYVETNKERIIAENLLPDDAIVSRAANQSLLADILQVITGHDLIVRPQYLASCIATSCKFVIHKGDHGADMIDCRSQLSLYLPTADGDRLSIAEVAVSIVFSPNQPMIEFRVVKIDVLLKDFSKLSSVAAFLNEMDVPIEDHEVIDSPPDMYRDAFLEKSQRFFALSSEGMKSAFQQMIPFINLKGKMKSISSFMPDTDQVLAAEQEAMAFAEARRIEQEQQRQRGPSFPRPPPPPPPQLANSFRDQSQHDSQATESKRPKSILGGLVRSGWKTLANSVAIPDDDPDIYGQFAPSQPPRGADPQIKFYRKEENVAPAGQNLFRNDDAQNRGHNPQMHFQQQEDSRRDLQGTNMPDRLGENESSVPNSFGLHSANHENSTVAEHESTNSGLNDGPVPPNADHDRNIVQPIGKQTEEIYPTEDIPGLEEEEELQEANKQEINDEEVEKDFDDGWDEGLDGFDDISDHLEGFPNPTGISPHPDQEVVEPASDIVLVEKTVPSCEIKYDEEDDVCDTRRRW
eukprot:CAMPEP_0116119978 /NCGR_PEP_ID=MMETSP0329-20121206/2936_1 /TAXON_ID=697910 /ORGANISM="Pseudo-nitzschia arenysensis, Strain B593" /LENGTH=840 /DNA_ID=CAMNT_0003613729 /DNA_START=31 /DNA_END=2551 /DNA_ORIENTATION=+